jgi:integrase
LKRLKARQAEEKLALGQEYRETNGVFTWEDGRMVEPLFLSHHFGKIVKREGLTGVHFHSLRHSYASMLLKAGEHPEVVQELLGHSNINMTLDIYSHISDGLKEKAAAKLNEILPLKTPSVEEGG